MKTSDTLYAAADYIRENGFSFEMYDGCARCIAGAVVNIGTGRAHEIMCHTFLPTLCMEWDDISAEALERNHWTADDAIAALEIAADIACAEGN